MTLSDIQAILDKPIDYSDRSSMENKMADCLNAIGPSTKLMAKSLGDLERAKGKAQARYPDAPYRLLKLRMDSETAGEQETHLLATRLNVSLFKAIDGLKSLLSIQEGDEQELKWK